MNAQKLKGFKNAVNALFDTDFKENDCLLAIVHHGEETHVAVKGQSVAVACSLAYHALQDKDFYGVLKSVINIVDEEKQDAKKS
jgi:hypothetical protein